MNFYDFKASFIDFCKENDLCYYYYPTNGSIYIEHSSVSQSLLNVTVKISETTLMKKLSKSKSFNKIKMDEQYQNKFLTKHLKNDEPFFSALSCFVSPEILIEKLSISQKIQYLLQPKSDGAIAWKSDIIFDYVHDLFRNGNSFKDSKIINDKADFLIKLLDLNLFENKELLKTGKLFNLVSLYVKEPNKALFEPYFEKPILNNIFNIPEDVFVLDISKKDLYNFFYSSSITIEKNKQKVNTFIGNLKHLLYHNEIKKCLKINNIELSQNNKQYINYRITISFNDGFNKNNIVEFIKDVLYLYTNLNSNNNPIQATIDIQSAKKIINKIRLENTLDEKQDLSKKQKI